eukprot:6022952-Pleurochrysis_carterae.AAC.2
MADKYVCTGVRNTRKCANSCGSDCTSTAQFGPGRWWMYRSSTFCVECGSNASRATSVKTSATISPPG